VQQNESESMSSISQIVRDRDTVNALYLRGTLTPLNSAPGAETPKDLKLDAQGNHAIIILQTWPSGTEDGALSVIDVSHPSKPQVVGQTSIEQPREMAINNNFVYTAGGTAFRVVDISVRTNPQRVGSATAGNDLFSVDVDSAGSRAYCADNASSGGIVVFDVTTPSSPSSVTVNGDATGFNAGSVRLDEARNILFATDSSNNAIKAFDTQSGPPLNQLGNLSVSVPQDLVYLALDTANNLAFVGEFGTTDDDVIAMIDITDPSNMQEIDRFIVNPSVSDPSLQAIQVYDSKLYVSHAEGGSNETAFLSVLQYTRDGFGKPVRFFTGNVQDFAKVQIGRPGLGPIDGFDVRDNTIYAPLLNANDGRGALVIPQEIQLIKR